MALLKLAKYAVSPVAAALGVFDKKKAAPAPTYAAPAATPRANSVLSDALSRRRGAAANQVTGAGGAESTTTAKKSLLGQ